MTVESASKYPTSLYSHSQFLYVFVFNIIALQRNQSTHEKKTTGKGKELNDLKSKLMRIDT